MDKYVERIDRCSRSCRFGDIRENMVVQMVIKGMKEDKLRKELLLKRGLDLQKVRELCGQYETAMAASRIIAKGPIQEVEAIEKEQEAEVNWVGSYRGRGVGNYRGRGRGTATGFKCYSCGGSGHMTRNCPSPQDKQDNAKKEAKKGECYTCGEEGHFSRECPKSKNKKGQQKRMHMVEERQHSDTLDSSL